MLSVELLVCTVCGNDAASPLPFCVARATLIQQPQSPSCDVPILSQLLPASSPRLTLRNTTLDRRRLEANCLDFASAAHV